MSLDSLLDHEAQLPVRLTDSKAWQLLAHALRTPEKGGERYLLLRTRRAPWWRAGDWGLWASVTSRASSIESGKDLPYGTPVEVVDLIGKVVADLFVGVHALLLMQAVRKQIEQQGSWN
jgi:hypothetical protein